MGAKVKGALLSVASLAACALFVGGGVRALAACASDPDPEIVVGVSTQMRVPKEIRSARVRLEPEGAAATCATIDLVATPLPRTVRATGNGAITVTVAAFAGPPPEACDDLTGAVVVRRATTRFVSGESLYLPMPLKYTCSGVTCDAGQTCLGGACASDTVDSNGLVEYDDALLFGGTSFCLSRGLCLDDRVPALLLDPKACTFQLTADVTIDKGINVELVNDNLSREVLDLDPVEGYTVDASVPDQFRLAPSLCARYAAGKIASISVGVGCPSKKPLNPMCQNEPFVDGGRIPAEAPELCTSSADLAPAKGGLYLLVDRSRSMEGFFGQGPNAIHEKLGLALRSPLLRSSRVAFHFFPASGGDCAASPNAFAAPAAPAGFGLTAPAQAATAADGLLADLGNVMPNDPPALVDAVLRNSGGAYDTLAAMGDARAFPRREVLFLGNRDFAAHCAPAVGLPNEEAFTAEQTKKLATGAILLAAPPGTDQGGRDPYIDAVTFSRAGGGAFIDTSFDPSLTTDAITAAISDLGLCLYDAPSELAGADLTTAKISYFDPLKSDRVDIPFAADCAESSPAYGFNIDDGRVRLCGKACTDLGFAVKAGAVYALDHHVPPPDIPVKWAPLCK